MFSVMRGGVRVSVAPSLPDALLPSHVLQRPRRHPQIRVAPRARLSRLSLYRRSKLRYLPRSTLARPTSVLASNEPSAGWRMGSLLDVMGRPPVRSKWQSLATICPRPEMAPASGVSASLVFRNSTASCRQTSRHQ